MATDEERNGNVSLVQAAPVLARLAVSAWWRLTGLSVEALVSAWTRAVRGAMNGESPTQIIQGTEAELREYLRRVLGVEQMDGRAPEGAPSAAGDDARAARSDGALTPEALRERGAELLRRSAEVDVDEEAHPAFERILEQLTPDEGRILRLLALEGPQPSVDVRTGGPMGLVKSDLVAPGLTMIGNEAGCRRPDRVHSYLNNLYRLGLIWFSREELDDLQRYLVLEVQPEVAEAMKRAGRGRTVRRSIHLTEFGLDFCKTCLPLESVEIDALPGSVAPDE
jgi:hypothetical protein